MRLRAATAVNPSSEQIPAALHMKAISTEVDYAETTIGDKKYLLPSTATVTVLTDTGRNRNELEFQGYRKFDSDSVIRFDQE